MRACVVGGGGRVCVFVRGSGPACRNRSTTRPLGYQTYPNSNLTSVPLSHGLQESFDDPAGSKRGIAGCREHVFTDNVSSLANFMAVQVCTV